MNFVQLGLVNNVMKKRCVEEDKGAKQTCGQREGGYVKSTFSSPLTQATGCH